MIPDALILERARHQAESSAALVREQLLLISDLHADGRPSTKAEDLLRLLLRTQSAFRGDVEFLQRNLGRAHG